MPRSSLCLRIPKKQGEKGINIAKKLDLINTSLIIIRGGENLCIPLRREPSDAEITILKSILPVFKVDNAVFERRKHAQTINQALESKLPPNLLNVVPQAFDIVGDIIITEIPPQLELYQTLIGEALLEIYKNIQTVLGKAGDVSGIYRIRNYTFIAGKQKTYTIHREFGCTYHVDLAKAYFSPRLSHEHQRVTSQVQAGEIVADLFAGVGPFSVLIGKQCPLTNIYAVDLNPEAIELLKLNVKTNKVDDHVFPILSSAREITSGRLKGMANRVIMNLPETALDFVDAACNAIRPEGGIIHFYSFVRSPDTIDNLKQRFTAAVETCNRKVETIVFCRNIRETAPYEAQVVLDVRIK